MRVSEIKVGGVLKRICKTTYLIDSCQLLFYLYYEMIDSFDLVNPLYTFKMTKSDKAKAMI